MQIVIPFRTAQYTIITTVTAKHCSLCHCTLPTDTTKRRRLHGISSSLAPQVFLDVSSQAGLKNVVSLEDRGPRNGPFLCLKCHSQLDKTAKYPISITAFSTARSTSMAPSAIAFKFLCRVSKHARLQNTHASG